MKTIRIALDDEQFQKVNWAAQLQGVTRSQFIRNAIECSIRQLAIEELEGRQAEGYRRYPVTIGEFDVWEAEQEWG